MISQDLPLFLFKKGQLASGQPAGTGLPLDLAVSANHGAAEVGGIAIRSFSKKTWLGWPFQVPKLEVPTIYKAYFSGLCKWISPENMAKNMVQYLQFRFLKWPLMAWEWREDLPENSISLLSGLRHVQDIPMVCHWMAFKGTSRGKPGF
jgi:hypothetical protein